MFSPRLRQRLWRHHLPICLASLAGIAVFYLVRPIADLISRLSFATSYPGLILLAAALLVGPVRILMGNRMAASIDLRRDIGIWAGLVGFAHAVIGQCVHLRGRPWLYYIYDHWRTQHVQPLRHDFFGFANYTGLAATLVLLALLATSNDASLRKLGTPGWKKLQRWNYACFALTGVHTFLYQKGVESQTPVFLGIAILAVGATLALQIAGYLSRRKAREAIETA